jgi:hypothetical protein
LGLDRSLDRVGKLEYSFAGLMDREGKDKVRMWNRNQVGFEKDMVKFKSDIQMILERNRKVLAQEDFTPDFGEEGGAARRFVKKMAETVWNLEKQYDLEMENFEKIVTSTNVESDVIAALKERIEIPVLANIENELRLKQEAKTLELNSKDSPHINSPVHYSKIRSKVDTGRKSLEMGKPQPRHSFQKLTAPVIHETEHEGLELTFQNTQTPDISISECPDGESDQLVTETRQGGSLQEEGSPSLDQQIIVGKKDDTVSNKSGGDRRVSCGTWNIGEIEPTVTMDANTKNPKLVSEKFLANRKQGEAEKSN